MNEDELREMIAKMLDERAAAWRDHKFVEHKNDLAAECSFVAQQIRKKATSLLPQ